MGGTWAEAFQNRGLKIFGPTRDDVTGGWGNLHNEELRDLHLSPSIITIITSRMRWEEDVARMREPRND
jgi:hypothetical protein